MNTLNPIMDESDELARLRAQRDALAEALQDIELRACQDKLASTIGNKNHTEFLRGALERIQGAARAALESVKP